MAEPHPQSIREEAAIFGRMLLMHIRELANPLALPENYRIYEMYSARRFPTPIGGFVCRHLLKEC